MNIDPELLEKVQKENEEFRGLYREHITLKQKQANPGSISMCQR